MITDEQVERVALALLKFENMGNEFEVPDGLDKWPVIMNDRGKAYWREKARVAIAALQNSQANMEEDRQ